jgi:hypothetical protein
MIYGRKYNQLYNFRTTGSKPFQKNNFSNSNLILVISFISQCSFSLTQRNWYLRVWSIGGYGNYAQKTPAKWQYCGFIASPMVRSHAMA